jgi:hypothetical protein
MNADIIWTIGVLFLALTSIGLSVIVYGCFVVAARAESPQRIPADDDP